MRQIQEQKRAVCKSSPRPIISGATETVSNAIDTPSFLHHHGDRYNLKQDCRRALDARLMTSGPMRKLSTPNASFLRWKSLLVHTHRLLVAPTPVLRQVPQTRSLAQVRSDPFSDLWFTPSPPACGPADELLNPSGELFRNGGDHKPPDERILKLGKSEQTRLLYQNNVKV